MNKGNEFQHIYLLSTATGHQKMLEHPIALASRTVLGEPTVFVSVSTRFPNWLFAWASDKDVNAG